MNTATARQINKPGSIDKAVKPGAAGAGAKPKRAPMGKEQKHQLIVIGIAAAVVCSVGVAIYAYFNYSRTSHKPPRLDAAPVVMAKFIATNDFDHLPFDRQRLYMKELSGKKKELEEQYKAGNLSKNDLEDALSVVWLGKQFKHLDHYYSLGELDKKNYLDELIDDQLKDDPKGKDEPSKDKSKIKGVVERFPDRERRDYDAFRKSLKEREKERDKEAKAAAKAARSTSRPTTRPSERPATGANTAKPAAGK